jgi:DNA-binding NtrC family response regulator
LSRYPWPGNVRELRNVIELVAVTAGEVELLGAWSLPPAISGAAEPNGVEPATPAGGRQHFRAIADELAELERRRMREAIAACDGVLKHAAQLIGMPLRTFHLKAKQYGLSGKRA